MTPTSIEAFRSWLREVSGDERVEQLNLVWADFAGRKQPVVTLFGAFDTGKSSILRRLLVDSNHPLPEWLTTSARHETFDSQLIDVEGYAVRDTPGLSPEGTDARSLENTRVARESLGLTDVLTLTLNPQLATGEREELIEILSDEWPTSSVWFLISRADEGGVDPTLDPTGFDEWSQRKREELKHSLNLADDVPIYVVVPDYGQIAAFEADPEPSIWDDSRQWDGMDGLRTALEALADEDLRVSRKAAERRFWRGAVNERLEDVRRKLANLATSRDTATTSLQKRDVFLNHLDSLLDAAEVSIEGTAEDAIRRVLVSPQIDASSIQNTVDPVLEEWWHEQQAELSRIRQDSTRTFDQQREGRAWSTFESLYSTRLGSAPEGIPAAQIFTPRFDKLGRKAVDGLKAADAVRKAQRKVKKPAEAAEVAESALDLGQFAGIGAAALPFVVELAGVVEDIVQTSIEKARQRARRQQLETEVSRIVKDAAKNAMKRLAPDIETLRQEISAQTIGQHEVDDLDAAVDLATKIVARGDELVSVGRERPKSFQ